MLFLGGTYDEWNTFPHLTGLNRGSWRVIEEKIGDRIKGLYDAVFLEYTVDTRTDINNNTYFVLNMIAHYFDESGSEVCRVEAASSPLN